MAFVPMDLPGGSRSTTLPAPERHICCLSPFLQRPPVRGRNKRTGISSGEMPAVATGVGWSPMLSELAKWRSFPEGFNRPEATK